MTRIAFVLLICAAIAALLTRAAAPRWVLFTILGLMILYTILKVTGAIEALAPDHVGVL